MAATVRRVVIGEDANGKAVLSKLEEIEPALGAVAFYGVWGWDETPRLPANPTGEYDHVSVFPPLGGMRVNICEFPPGGAPAAADPAEGHAAFDRLRSARPVHRELDERSGFVKTDSVDLGFVLKGEIVIELDDGVEVTMRPGDVYVQNGARHAWHNRGDEPCLIAWVVFAAEHDDE
jgi:mannose-6-phosphate isomerase-like protein (cupin superfamily)